VRKPSARIGNYLIKAKINPLDLPRNFPRQHFCLEFIIVDSADPTWVGPEGSVVLERSLADVQI
jgi:hypothetical protein